MTSLRRWFLEYNKRYFGNKLPKECIVKWAFQTKEWMGRQSWRKLKKGAPKTPIIQVSAKYRFNKSVAHLTLLHEMVHLALPKRVNHGPRFHKEMLRLAKAGAFSRWW
jgi:hypothetical protein